MTSQRLHNTAPDHPKCDVEDQKNRLPKQCNLEDQDYTQCLFLVVANFNHFFFSFRSEVLSLVL